MMDCLKECKTQINDIPVAMIMMAHDDDNVDDRLVNTIKQEI